MFKESRWKEDKKQNGKQWNAITSFLQLPISSSTDTISCVFIV